MKNFISKRGEIFSLIGVVVVIIIIVVLFLRYF